MPTSPQGGEKTAWASPGKRVNNLWTFQGQFVILHFSVKVYKAMMGRVSVGEMCREKGPPTASLFRGTALKFIPELAAEIHIL
jgi:hypothetical protein